MTAPKRVATLIRVLESVGADALPAILGYLQAHPATYEQLIECAFLARPWQPTSTHAPEGWVQRRDAKSGRELSCVVMSDGRWVAEVLDQELEGAWYSPREAQGAADQALAEAGYTLIDPVTP